MQLTGIHHLTAVSADAPGNVKFYTQVLGMRLVKKTVNQDDVSAYHLFYADGEARPGTDLTFFDWPAAPEKRGTHSIVRTGLRVAGASLPWWKERLTQAAVRHQDIVTLDGRLTLELEDPEGQRLALIDDGGAGDARPWAKSPVPAEHQIRGLGPITLSVPELRATDVVLREVMGLTKVRDYPHPQTKDVIHVYQMGEGGTCGGASRRGAAGPAGRGAGRGRGASRRVPHARRGIRRLGGSAEDAWAFPNSGKVDRFYFRSSLFPRAERHPVRDRDRRPGLCDRRADGEARREAVAAAVPGAAAEGDRGGAEAALGCWRLSWWLQWSVSGGALPPPERGRVGEGVVSCQRMTPTRFARQTDLPLSGGG